jgi:CAAX prenyl protease-like protein
VHQPIDRPIDRLRAWLASPSAAYVLPFAAFIAITELARQMPGSTLISYPLKTLLTVGLLWRYRRHYTELAWHWSWLAVATGAVVFALWIPLSQEPLVFGAPVLTVSPYQLAGRWAIPWITVRLLGSTFVVPVMEELFWRSFMARYLLDAEFKRVPLGTFTTYSLLISCALFGVEHTQWVAGIMAGLVYSWLLHRTRSLGACVLAHGVTNFLLGVYVLATGSWWFW